MASRGFDRFTAGASIRQRHAHFKSPKGNELTAMKIYTTPVAPPVFLNRSGVLRYQFSKAWQFLNFVPRQPFA
jgi:hypothetical protein